MIVLQARVSTLLLAALLGFAEAVTANAPRSARDWLDKLAHAVRSLNYQGDFVYQHGHRLEAMRYIHGVDTHQEKERLIHLNGPRREVVRDQDLVTCIFPDQQSVIVERSHGRSPLPAAVLANADALQNHYTLSLGGTERMAGHKAQKIIIQPKDEFRYGYRLWVDETYGLLLKSELVNPQGQIVEQVMFTSLWILDHMPWKDLQPSAPTEFTWYTDSSQITQPVVTGDQGWRAGWVPEGFTLANHYRRPMTGSLLPVEHILFTDGLASVSIFIKKRNPHPAAPMGASGMGAVNAYSTQNSDYRITVVGEVPASTVKRIAESIYYQQTNHD
jgi:sigma-E factor negative regulatory protein RseB